MAIGYECLEIGFQLSAASYLLSILNLSKNLLNSIEGKTLKLEL